MAATNLSTETKEMIEQLDQSLMDGRYPIRLRNDEAVFELEQDRVFNDNWVFIGHESEIPEPGDYARRYIGGSDPFIFTRDEDGNVQVLFDSCGHRGTKLCRAEQGNTSHFRCPYHGWTYNNKGELVGVTFKHEAYKEIDPDEWKLPKPAKVDSYAGLVFATMNPDSPSLEEHLGDMKWYIDMNFKFPTNGMEVYGEPYRYVLPVDWKQPCENFGGDDYHISTTHQSAIEGGLISEIWHWDEGPYGGLAERVHTHFEELPEMGHSFAAGMIGEDYSPFYGYDEEIHDCFSAENISQEQYDLARRSVVNIGTIFPNLSFIQVGKGTGSNDSGFLCLRQWQPRAPGETELWSWVLVPKDAPEEQKRKINNVALSSFTPAGNWEQDDLAVWDGITEAAGSTVAKRQGVETSYEMGLGNMSNTEIHDEWPGPGVCYNNHYQEGYGRWFHRRWQEEITKEPLPEGAE
ncbi:aromatic ring-hydroxylating oxygenase subunit alpha [Natrarchaeobius oligotrophus]|uniref:Ring-hydroxylating oxygenase subunit alpha n=1 Tax=Natrarchaeobius chitinivorans TaxID=1679083 RepID=A0A3N6MPE1_NATCH|nr:Rieske 2Fe-2S domain-containing protein [Natrarchaeobius chitinivorans]RQG99440.1 ring-hydroxylating oxygenase subunit alpha [Natrarchaeobius chitinivorans]